MEGHIDLVLLLVALFRDCCSGLMESIFLHHALDAFESMGDLLRGVEFAKLQTSSAGELVRGGIR